MSAPERGRIETVWDADSGEPAPAWLPASVVRVERCTACGEQRMTWTFDQDAGTDPWKHHFDHCGE